MGTVDQAIASQRSPADKFTPSLYRCCTLIYHTMCSAGHIHWGGMDKCMTQKCAK